MTEKYARMMESTFPEEYRKLAASLPPVDKETLQKIEEIVAINVGWKAELFDRYPRLSGRAARCAPEKTPPGKRPLKRICGEN